MRVERANLGELSRRVFDLGYVGEKNHTKVVLVCTSMFKDYPDAVVTMVAKPPVGDIYPIVLERDGNLVVWNVSEGDIAYPGSGQFQLTFTEGEEVIKREYGYYSVKESMEATGEAPDPVQTWVDEANEKIAEIDQIIDGLHTVPSGGSSGQVLAKASGTDYDVEWVNQSGGGGGNLVTPEFTSSGSAWSCDMTFAEVLAAVKDGTCTSCIVDGDETFYLSLYHNSRIVFKYTYGNEDYMVFSMLEYTPSGITATGKSGTFTANIAGEYDLISWPVSKGTLCTHKGNLYKANQDILNNEEWTAAHWTQVNVADELGSIKNDISDIEDDLADKADKSDLNGLEDDVESIQSLFDIEAGGNLFNKDGEYLNNSIIKGSTGAILSETGYGVQYIPFEGAGTYSLLFPCDYYGATRRICLYDSTKTYLRTIEGSGSTGATAPAPCKWTISTEASADAAFIGYAFKKSSMDSAMFVKADTYPDEYIPYGNSVCKFLGTIDAENVENLDDAIDKRIETKKPIRSRMEFGAHNGAEYYAPECTVPAYRIAGQQGWEWAWIAGIDFSSENSMYVIHDATVDRTTDGTGTLSTMTDAQIDALKIDQTGEGYDLSDFDPAELHIPTFEEVVQQCVRYGMKMCIRLVNFPPSMNTDAKAAKWNGFKAVMDAYNVQNSDVTFYVDATSATMANTVRTLFGNDTEICVFLGSTQTAQNGIDWFNTNSITGKRAFIINKNNLDLTAVKLLHTNGIRVYGYGGLTQADINQFATWGVDIAQNSRYYSITE